MLHNTIDTGRTLVPDSLTFATAGNAVWAVTADGSLVAVRLFDEQLVLLGSGYVDPVGVVPAADGLRLVVAEAGGAVWVARRDAADRTQARPLAQVPGAALAVKAHLDAGHVLVLTDGSLDGGPPGQLLSCDLASGELDVVASGLDHARTFVIDETPRRATILSVLPDDSRSLTTVALDDGSASTLTGLQPYDHLTTAPPVGDAGVVVSRADPTTPGTDVLVHLDGFEVTVESVGATVDGLTRWGSMVLVASGQQLIAVDWELDEGVLPITAPLGPLYASGYARLVADLPSLGLTVGEVAYAVREGTDGGSVSAGLEAVRADGTQSVMLLAGVRSGEFHLEATLVADGSLLAVRRFRVTTLWPDDEYGPPVAVTGDHGSLLMSWGGVGGTAGYLHPAVSPWRVLVVLVYLRDRGWDGLEVAARGDWQERVVGNTESVRRFYEEVSAFDGVNGMTVELVGDEVFGPVLVDAGWGDVFKAKEAGDLNAGWVSKPTGLGALAGAICDFFADLPSGASLMALADTISIVVRSGSDTPTDIGPLVPQLPTRYVWGHASSEDVDLYRKTATLYTQFKRPVTVMTDRYPAGAPTRNPTFTLCHEVGHTLGLDDLYDAHGDYPDEIDQRRLGGIDLMSDSQSLPHLSLANRIRLGWASRAWLRRFDFSADPSGDTVVLQATETLTAAGPTAGRSAGIEVPITDDWSYLFEYRREQPGQIGDQRLESSVVTGRTEILAGTDLRVRGGEVARPPIIRLGNDLDGDGPLLVNNGQDYVDSDVTNPERMHDFVLSLTGIGSPDPDSAEVRVEYLKAHRPQLQVRPAPGRGNFKSPDIELVGPFGGSVPGAAKGMPNTIKVTVHNVGSLAATATQIHVTWLPFTVTPGAWTNLADPAPFDVAALGQASVEVPWNIPASVKVGDVEAEHFCVRVEIDRYRDLAHPEHEEIVVVDNWAQSNFDTKPLGFGSPSDRVATVTTATNVLSRTATYLFGAEQTTPWYRVFLGHAWLRLEPGQTGAIELGYESLADDPVFGEGFAEHIEQITSRDHQVAVTSRVIPAGTECDTPRTVFGVGLTLRAGFRVLIDDVGWNSDGVSARVWQVSNGTTFPMSFGEFRLAAWPDDEPEHVSRTAGRVAAGFGRAPLSDQTVQDLADGRRVWFSVARPGDNSFAAAVTAPAVLE